jgi:hypothetical protein
MKRLALIAVLTGFLLLNASVSAWALYTLFEQTNHNRAANSRIWHAVICDIQTNTLKSRQGKSAKAKDINAFLDFYDHLLVADAHAAPCGLPRRSQ